MLTYVSPCPDLAKRRHLVDPRGVVQCQLVWHHRLSVPRGVYNRVEEIKHRKEGTE